MTPVCFGSFWTTRDWLCTIVVRAREIVTDGVGDQQPLLWVLSGLLVGLVAPIIWIVASRYLTRKRAKAGSAPAEHTDESGKSTSPHGGPRTDRVPSRAHCTALPPHTAHAHGRFSFPSLFYSTLFYFTLSLSKFFKICYAFMSFHFSVFTFFYNYFIIYF